MEAPVTADDLGATWHHVTLRSDGEPVSNLADGLFRLTAVCVNVMAGNIRNKLPIAISVGIQNQSYLFPLGISAEALAAQE